MLSSKPVQRHLLGPLLVGLTIVSPAQLAGQVVRGRVVEDSTGSPVAAASVTLINANGTIVGTAQSDPEGTFTVAARPGEYLLRVQRIGYREWRSPSFRLDVGQNLDLARRLGPLPVELEPAVVVGQPPTLGRSLPEFERRREHGLGKFITRVEFEKSNPRQLTDVLLRMPGLRLERNPCYMMEATGPCRNPSIVGADTRRYILRPRGGPISLGNAAGEKECGVLVYLDGRYVGDGLRVELDLVPVEQVEAIEVYTGASQIPTELNRTGSACGVIVIWTR